MNWALEREVRTERMKWKVKYKTDNKPPEIK